jgi:uncharacterized protein (TIGR01777 family)
MKLVIPGGSGQIGGVVARAFGKEGHEVVVLGRTPDAARAARMRSPATGVARTVAWDGATLGEWAREIDGADVVLNLAGRSVNCRYGPRNRAAMVDSRVNSTRVVGEAIARAARPPRVWLQASTATIYAHRYDAPNDEATGILGGGEPGAPEKWDFSIEVAKAWERTLAEAATPRTRKVALRSAMTMSPDRGGIFDTLLALVRRGLGGTSGDGRQYISWVHERDFVRALLWLIEHDDVDGTVNVAAPGPLPNAEFMRELRKAWGAPIGLPASEWMLAIGAVLMRTETELIRKSRRVVPGRLLARGFTFEFGEWSAAARDLCDAWQRERRGA